MLATYLRMSLIGTRRKRQKIFSFLWRTNVEVSSQRKRHQRGITKTRIPKTQISDLRPRKLRPRVPQTHRIFFIFNIFIANSSQFLAPNVLWSRNVHRQQPERSEIFIFSGLSLARFKVTADILMVFASEFFT